MTAFPYEKSVGGKHVFFHINDLNSLFNRTVGVSVHPGSFLSFQSNSFFQINDEKVIKVENHAQIYLVQLSCNC